MKTKKSLLTITDGDQCVSNYPHGHSLAEFANLSRDIPPDHVLANVEAAFVLDAERPYQEANTPSLVIRDPAISQIGDAVNVALVSHRKTGGSTVSVSDGNLVGRKLHALSIFPGRTKELYDPPTWRQLFVFALENSDLLLRRDCALGTWCHRRLHVLDIVVCISNLQAALELAKCFDQHSIYSLELRREIAILIRSFLSNASGRAAMINLLQIDNDAAHAERVDIMLARRGLAVTRVADIGEAIKRLQGGSHTWEIAMLAIDDHSRPWFTVLHNLQEAAWQGAVPDVPFFLCVSKQGLGVDFSASD